MDTKRHISHCFDVASRRSAGRRVRPRAFTMIELLVVISVIVILLSLLMPALGKGLEAARSFKCQTTVRGIAFDFAMFADKQLHGSRGNDSAIYGPNRFSLETFIESEYCIDEFWCFGDVPLYENTSSDDRMRCSEVSGPVTLRKDVPCREGAVGPSQNVSYAFNLRLLRAEYKGPRGRPRMREVQLSSLILARSDVPLVIDADGEAAAVRDALPHYVAPSLDSQGPLAGDRYWFPSSRHSKKTNVGFVDGSVRSSFNPEAFSGWSYKPPRM